MTKNVEAKLDKKGGKGALPIFGGTYHQILTIASERKNIFDHPPINYNMTD